MDTSWWPVAVVVVLAVVAGLVDSWGRLGRAHRRPGARRRRGAAPEPQPGEVWWAEAPYVEGAERGVRERPCLVLKVADGIAAVADIATGAGAQRPGAIPLPPGSVGDPRGRPGFLEPEELREAGVWAFRRRVGPVDAAVWDRVKHLADS